MNCEILGKLRIARAAVKDEQQNNGSRELALVLTKIDEGILWCQEDIRLKTPPKNECSPE